MLYKGNKLKEIIFPLGGIGTGSIGLAGNGALVDWEIMVEFIFNCKTGWFLPSRFMF